MKKKRICKTIQNNKNYNLQKKENFVKIYQTKFTETYKNLQKKNLKITKNSKNYCG